MARVCRRNFPQCLEYGLQAIFKPSAIVRGNINFALAAHYDFNWTSRPSLKLPAFLFLQNLIGLIIRYHIFDDLCLSNSHCCLRQSKKLLVL